MVLSIITLAAVTPLLATSTLQLQETAQKQQQEQQEQQRKEQDDELKTEKHHLRVRASARMSEARKEIVKDRVVSLQNGKLYVEKTLGGQDHPFTGYFLPYPERDFDGVVTTIDKQNMLNWIYIDPSTYEVKYGVRAVSDKNLTGPMNMASTQAGETRLAFLGWEGFCAVEEEPDRWALYFDKENNGLKGKVHGKKITEVELIRDTSEETKARLRENEID